jgi:hypothetical protein
MRQRIQTDREWAADKVAPFPVRWQGRLISAWERERKGAGQGYDFEAQRAANIRLRETADQLSGVRLTLDAQDHEVCVRATEMAKQCSDMQMLCYFDMDLARESMARICNRYGVKAPRGKSVTVTGGIARMTCPLWWRRQLRVVHAKAVEGAAISLGYVHKRSDLYVSNESLQRRLQQNARNQDTLENTTAVNELGQEYTLAELAATGTANKSIRRAELMTRISGFERIARDMQHEGLFFTVTCPSRMHKWKTHKGGVVPNRKYDGTTPAEAQAYLAKVWARIRAKLQRDNARVYGFRIAEPNHDGTPHWHLLVFHEAGKLETIRATVLEQALKDSPDEAGAHTHRVDFKVIDWSKGTAAGYIAKYVAKNIDGYKVEKDLHGNDALETSARVEAWAATWRIRQFQQVGGPPVGPWRELRRCKEVPAGAPEYLEKAHRAVNKLAVIEGRENASVAWDAYCKAQGGVYTGRAYRIKVAKVEVEGVGRYGEPLADKPIGVETVNKEFYTPAHMAHMGKVNATRLVHWLVESVRHAWVIVSKKKREVEGKFKGALRPWTCVNNCTLEGKQNGVWNRNNGYNTNKKSSNGGGFGAQELGKSTSAHQIDGRGIRQTNFGSNGCDWCGA